MRYDVRFRLFIRTETAECGLACLAMICMGILARILTRYPFAGSLIFSARGINLAGINNGIAEQLGMITRALSLELDELGALKHDVFSTGISVICCAGQRKA